MQSLTGKEKEINTLQQKLHELEGELYDTTKEKLELNEGLNDEEKNYKLLKNSGSGDNFSSRCNLEISGTQQIANSKEEDKPDDQTICNQNSNSEINDQLMKFKNKLDEIEIQDFLKNTACNEYIILLLQITTIKDKLLDQNHTNTEQKQLIDELKKNESAKVSQYKEEIEYLKSELSNTLIERDRDNLKYERQINESKLKDKQLRKSQLKEHKSSVSFLPEDVNEAISCLSTNGNVNLVTGGHKPSRQSKLRIHEPGRSSLKKSSQNSSPLSKIAQNLELENACSQLSPSPNIKALVSNSPSKSLKSARSEQPPGKSPSYLKSCQTTLNNTEASSTNKSKK